MVERRNVIMGPKGASDGIGHGRGSTGRLAPPVNIRFNPTTKTGSKMGGAPTNHKGTIGFDPQPQGSVGIWA